jgi:hypothetical protein
MVLIGENGGTLRETCAIADLSPQIPCELLGLNVVLCNVETGDKPPVGTARIATRR